MSISSTVVIAPLSSVRHMATFAPPAGQSPVSELSCTQLSLRAALGVSGAVLARHPLRISAASSDKCRNNALHAFAPAYHSSKALKFSAFTRSLPVSIMSSISSSSSVRSALFSSALPTVFTMISIIIR